MSTNFIMLNNGDYDKYVVPKSRIKEIVLIVNTTANTSCIQIELADNDICTGVTTLVQYFNTIEKGQFKLSQYINRLHDEDEPVRGQRRNTAILDDWDNILLQAFQNNKEDK